MEEDHPLLNLVSSQRHSSNLGTMEADTKPRAIFMAFGTKGDVFPIAAIAAAFAVDQHDYNVFLISHSAHQSLEVHLAEKGVIFVPISTPPVLSVHQVCNGSDSELQCFSTLKKTIKTQQRQECLDAIEKVFGDDSRTSSDFITINFFALDGVLLNYTKFNVLLLLPMLSHTAVSCIRGFPFYRLKYEALTIECYYTSSGRYHICAPSSFECQFKHEFPLLYEYFQEAPEEKVNWKDVLHWMWPLFLEDWGSWRQDCLNLSPIPFTDPVTHLPLWHIRLQSPLLLWNKKTICKNQIPEDMRHNL